MLLSLYRNGDRERTNMPGNNCCSYLIANADDYGYFEFVSKGILEASNNGIVRATGVLANSNFFDEHISWLREASNLDVGIHLSLTTGKPLSKEMQNALVQYNCEFPGKFTITKSILLGKIKLESIEVEWRAQIERYLSAGLKVNFINSHEHIHMLPSLFKLTNRFADEYKIPHIRFSLPESTINLSAGAFVRDSIMSLLGMYNKRHYDKPAARFLGMSKSGKLDLEYLKKCLNQMKPGNVYELMCHPGSYNNEKAIDASLLKYHSWNSELDALKHPSVLNFLSDKNIKLIGYRDLLIEGNQLKVNNLRDVA